MILNKYFQSIADLNDMNEIESIYSNMPEDLDVLDDDLTLEMEKIRLIEAEIVYKQRLRRFAVAERKNAVTSSGRNIRQMTSDGTIVVQPNGLLDTPKENMMAKLDISIPKTIGSGGSQSSSLKTGLCMNCGVEASLMCGKCRATPYCSDICGERDKTRHRAHCNSFMEYRKGGTDTIESKEKPQLASGKTSPRKPKSKVPENNNSGSSTPALRQPRAENNDYRAGRNQANRPNQGNRPNQDQNKGSNNSWKQMNNKPRQNNFDNNSTNRQSGNLNQTPEASTPAKLEPVVPPVQAKPVVPAPVKTRPLHSAPVAPRPLQSAPAKAFIPPLLPKQYIVEKLKKGDQICLGVESKDPTLTIPAGSMLCQGMQENYSDDYAALFDELAAACEEDCDQFTIKPGQVCCIKHEDGWYRARVLNKTQLALLDSAKIITNTPELMIRKLPQKFQDIVEFCCLLKTDVQCDTMLGIILESKSDGTAIVKLTNAEDGAAVGEGYLSRWLPKVTYEVVEETANGCRSGSSISVVDSKNVSILDSVPRPPVKNNIQAVIAHVESLHRIVLLPCDEQTRRQYDSLLHRAALHAQNATPMSVPATKGQVVLAKFTDGVHYRALVTRTNVAMNKYMLEYVEFGNTEISKLERLVECPPELNLDNEPSLVTVAAITTTYTETKKAMEYLNKLKENTEIILVSLHNGAPSAPAGSPVNLTLEDSREDINRTVERLCTPQWRIMEENGESVLDSEVIMDNQLEVMKINATAGVLRILDSSLLSVGRIACCPLPDAERLKLVNKLAADLEQYANSKIGKEPYLPRVGELCIVQHESSWHRALLCQQHTPGAKEVTVMLVDTGVFVNVPVDNVRKMLAEFIQDLPSHAVDVYIQDWPTTTTPEQVSRAKTHLNIQPNKETGSIRVTRCCGNDEGTYTVEANDLLAYMLS